jgi:hypothetical protein
MGTEGIGSCWMRNTGTGVGGRGEAEADRGGSGHEEEEGRRGVVVSRRTGEEEMWSGLLSVHEEDRERLKEVGELQEIRGESDGGE